MNKRKLGVAVSAMILAVHLGSPLASQPSLEQLTELATILTDNDVAALQGYLESNPELLVGDTQLAVLLRQFQSESQDINTRFGIEPNLRDALLRNPSLPELAEEGSDSGEVEEPTPDEEPDDIPDDIPNERPVRDPNEDPVSEPDDEGVY